MKSKNARIYIEKHGRDQEEMILACDAVRIAERDAEYLFEEERIESLHDSETIHYEMIEGMRLRAIREHCKACYVGEFRMECNHKHPENCQNLADFKKYYDEM